MKLRTRLGRTMGVLFATAGITTLSLGGVASASPQAAVAAAAPTPRFHCTFQTLAGYYLQADNGGGETENAIRTPSRTAGTWETFGWVDAGDGVHIGLETSNGNFVTATHGGGQATDALRTNETLLRSWEKFQPVYTGTSNIYALRTIDGHYITAVGEGAQTRDAVHSNATLLQDWEKFHLSCTS